MGKRIWAVATSLILSALLAGSAAGLTSRAIYDNIPAPLPGNLPSLGFEATSTSEFGDRVGFTSTERALTVVTLVMSSWGCQTGHWTTGDCATTPGATFSHPVTLNLYRVGTLNAPGASIGTVTQTFAMPYRPSADPAHCTSGRWFDAGSATCFNGKAFTITFDLTSLHVVLPDQIIFGIAYNTTHFGYSPIGATACSATAAGCGYDSLNVGVANPATTLSAGVNPAPSDAYLNSNSAREYCDSGVGGTGTFRLDAGCWTTFKPAIQFTATAVAVPAPTTKGQCKDDGWMRFNDPSFKNQGECVAYVEHLQP